MSCCLLVLVVPVVPPFLELLFVVDDAPLWTINNKKQSVGSLLSWTKGLYLVLCRKMYFFRSFKNHIISASMFSTPSPWEQCCHSRCDDPLQSFNHENNIGWRGEGKEN